MRTLSLVLMFLVVVVHRACCCGDFPKTCKEAGATTAGEYTLFLGPNKKAVKIFCNNDKEYITLKANNYGENKCDNAWAGCGRTTWRKIRLDPASLNVIRNDYTYSTTTKRKVPYGEGGGCIAYYKPSGGFSLDLTGTGFVFDATKTKWKAAGWRPKSVAQVNSNDKRKASGQCGGYCGHCQPTGSISLSI